MATSFADLGKNASDLLTDVFPGTENKFEAEVNAKDAYGSKVQVIVSKVKEGNGLLATFKPTHPFTLADNRGELKAQLSTDGKTKVDTTFNVNAVEGLKLKFGTTNTNFNGGFDFSSPSVNTNFKLDFPLQAPGQSAPTLDAASVFVINGIHSVGARVVYPLANSRAVPDVEGKLGLKISGNDLFINLARKNAKPSLGVSYLHRLSETRTLGSKVEFFPGQVSLANVILVTSNKVNNETTVKARVDTARGSLAFGVSNALNSNVTLEFGTDFRADLSAPSTYSLKVIYNN